MHHKGKEAQETKLRGRHGWARLNCLKHTKDPIITSNGTGIPATHKEVLADNTRKEEPRL